MFIQPQISIKKLSEYILKLSDYFIQNPLGQTPWDKEFCQYAYRHYYFPLNYLRNQLVIQRGKQVDFFKNIDSCLDWGSGPGTASLALHNELHFSQQYVIEKSQIALDRFQDIYSQIENIQTSTHLKLGTAKTNPHKTVLVFSYSLTEMNQLPEGWDQFEALMILEPSTRDDGRRLLDLREKLISRGYFIWAPCLHQNKCPLQIHSKNDWCHDRVHVSAPDWFKQLEQYLPFKNNTITTSYLLARKTQPHLNTENKIRLVGDSMNEKGKTRQLICRSEDREFLTWMHKEIEPQELPRGEIINLGSDFYLKSNEIRLTKKI